MNSAVVYRKTSKGNDEIKSRKSALDRRLRPLLILVDGQRPASVMTTLAAGIGIGADGIRRLEAGGYIEAMGATANAPEIRPDRQAPARPAQRPASAEPAAPPPRSALDRFSDARQYMNETVTDEFGFRALFFVLKVEKCATAQDLIALLPDFEQAIAKKNDAQHAANCRAFAMGLLGE